MVHHDGIGLEDISKRVVVDEVQMNIRKVAGAVVDLFHSILDSSRYEQTLAYKNKKDDVLFKMKYKRNYKV